MQAATRVEPFVSFPSLVRLSCFISITCTLNITLFSANEINTGATWKFTNANKLIFFPFVFSHLALLAPSSSSANCRKIIFFCFSPCGTPTPAAQKNISFAVEACLAACLPARPHLAWIGAILYSSHDTFQKSGQAVARCDVLWRGIAGGSNGVASEKSTKKLSLKQQRK